MRRLVALPALFLLALPVSALAGWGRNPLDNPNRIGRRRIAKGQPDFYSRAKAIAMGRRMARQFEDMATMYDDPATQAYVQRLTDRIVRHSDAKMPVETEVVLSNELDAFALPGGRLFVTTGLILRTRSEAELAGVIAHEVAHIAARDPTRQMTRAKLWRWISVPLLVFGGPAYFLGETMTASGPLAMRMFDRSAERRADKLGLQYLYESGYDPLGFVDFLEMASKLEKGSKSKVARAFSSHPLTRKRVRAAEREIERDLPPRPEYVVTTSAYRQMKARLERFMRDQMTLIPAKPKKPALRKRGGKKHSHRGELR